MTNRQSLDGNDEDEEPRIRLFMESVQEDVEAEDRATLRTHLLTKTLDQ